MKPALALIVLGGLIIIVAVTAGAIRHERDKERVAEFYRNHSNTANLPYELHVSTSPTEVIGFLAGGAMVVMGIRQSRAPATTPSAGPGSAG